MKLVDSLKYALLIVGALAALLSSALVQATDISSIPLIPSSVAKPNVIFGMDDSGSMDFEVMLTTNDGAFWWNDSTVNNGVTGAGWDSTGAPLYNSTGYSGGDWTKLAYLFPNGCTLATRILCDSSGHYAIAPTYQFAFLRSSTFNPLYYNPSVTYNAWTSAYIGGALQTYSASTGTAAPSRPSYSTTNDLTAAVAFPAVTTGDTVFQMQPGMVVPAGGRIYKNNAWATQASDYTIPTGSSYKAAFSYFPATYWVSVAASGCTVDKVTCTLAPDGSTLKRYEVKSGNTFPSGRTYAAELQNFANWFTYYRKRKLMLASSAGQVLDSLTGMRLGLVAFNNLSSISSMADTDLTDPAKNAKVIIGKFYGNASSGGTPTRETLKYIGDQFKSNTNIVTLSCQKNTAFIMTDGFANATSVTPPSYSSASYGGANPYTTTYAGSLSDIALSYYTNNIRPDLTAGTVPSATPTAANPQNDGNANPHMNTYAMTLGAKGTLWPTGTNAYTTSVNWPNPSVNGSPTAVDDLWHATINGRGQMFTAKTPAETAQSIQAALTSILSNAGSQSAVAFSTVNIRPDEAMGFAGSYTPVGWSGDVSAYPVDPVTGAMPTSTSAKLWSADALLQAKDYTQRAIATFSGVSGVGLNASVDWASMSARMPGTLTNFLAYVRGQRSNEGTTYRVRTGIIGAVVNAEPVSWLADKVIYAASNEGMLHAFDKASGAELWAYAPRFVLSDIVDKSKLGSTFTTVLDGTPTVTKISSTQTILVGGRGSAGTGFYALDVSNPRGLVSGRASATQSDANVAQRVLWEFPAATAASATVKALGTSTGTPIVVNTNRWGWVALVTSGYNSTLDGKGRLFVLNATTGTILDTLVTPSGTLTAEAGLSSMSALAASDKTVQYVYGGDLLGNLWKFDLGASSSSSASVTRLATLTNASNAALPITAAPELATLNKRLMVYVGTGKLLGTSDFTDTGTNTFFGIWDNGTEVNAGYVSTASATNVRKFLAARTITVNASAGTRSSTGNPLDWTTQRGWYVDAPAGEKSNTDPTLGLGVISWTTNNPSLATCTSSSALYYADAETGLQLSADSFPGGTSSYGTSFPTTLASRPVITRLPSGAITVTTHLSSNDTRAISLKAGTSTSNVTSFLKKGKQAWRQVLR